MSVVATRTYPASRPDRSLDGKVVLPGDARCDDARPPFRACSQQVNTMAMICKWVHANDGALVMEWTRAEDMHVRRGPGGQQPPSTAGLAVRGARVLMPLGGGNSDRPPAAGVSRTAGYPAGDEPAAIWGVTAIRGRAS